MPDQEKLHRITLEEMNHLAVDERTGRLYWKGRALEYRRGLTLWQTVGAFVVGSAVVLGAIATCVQAYEAWPSPRVLPLTPQNDSAG